MITVVVLKILLIVISLPSLTYAGFSNGECIKHRFTPDITYAVTGLNSEGSRYGLTVIEINSAGRMQPRSMIMGFPIHSSTIFVDQMFEKIECHWSSTASKTEIYDDWYDPYLNSKETIVAANKRIQMK